MLRIALGEKIHDLIGHGKRHAQCLEALGHRQQHALGYAAYLGAAESAENDRLVDAV